MSRAQANADVFLAIASPVRRGILELLRHGPQFATLIAERFEISQPAVSPERQGRERLYFLNALPLREVYDWIEHYERFWTEPPHAFPESRRNRP